jgi:hypothetical protein
MDIRAVYWGIGAAFGIAVFGIVARLQIMLGGLARPGAGNIFFRLYALHERLYLIALALSAVAAYVVMRTRSGEASTSWTRLGRLPRPNATALAITASLVLVATFAATRLVHHGLAFSMDEFSADFQARLFAAGRYQVSLPEAWRPFAPAIVPIFVQYRAASAAWLSAYLPGYALMKAPFVALGMPGLLNPLLAAVSVLALGAVARRLWPNEALRPWLAIALLVTSSQFIVTSGSAYSMPAHLCLNLVWLWLYMRGDARSWAAALAVGVLALGLHSPVPHALFVAPFLVRLVRDRRWDRVISAAVVYGAGAIGWLLWLRMAQPMAQGGAGGLLDIFSFPNGAILWLHAVNLSLLFTWQTPIFGVLAVAALIRADRFNRTLADLAWGVVLTLAFFTLFPATQGHGWGYRYAYQVLGSLALIAAAGLEPLHNALGERRTQALVAGSLVVTLVILLPLRLVETEQFVRPFAAGVAHVTSQKADVVLVHGDSVWYGRDLIRNDPFLRGQPTVVRASWITSEQRAALERAYPGRVVDVSDTDLLKLGMTLHTRRAF